MVSVWGFEFQGAFFGSHCAVCWAGRFPLHGLLGPSSNSLICSSSKSERYKEAYAKQERRFIYICYICIIPFGGFVCWTCVQDYVSLFCILLWPAFDQSSGWAKRLAIYRCRKGPPVHTSKRSFIQRTPTSKAANSKDFVFQIFSLIEEFHDKPKQHWRLAARNWWAERRERSEIGRNSTGMRRMSKEDESDGVSA